MEQISRHPDLEEPATRQLWIELTELATQRARKQGLEVSDVRFTQWETLQRSDGALRRHLACLVELEYVTVQRTGRGNLRAYQLVCLGDAAMNPLSSLGLVDVEQLRGAGLLLAGSPSLADAIRPFYGPTRRLFALEFFKNRSPSKTQLNTTLLTTC